MLRLILILSASAGLFLQSAVAQMPAVSWPPLTGLSASSLYIERLGSPLTSPRFVFASQDTVPRQIRPTHWKEGGMVGALLLGAFGTWFGYEICHETEAGSESGCMARSMLGGAIGGGGIGFLVGALIGGQFPKHPSSEPSQEPASGSGL
jgi:hypothetical protein